MIDGNKKHRMQTLWIVAIYALFGFAWIYGSDTVLDWLVADPATMTKIAIIKGSLYIFITASMLYAFISRFVQHIIAVEKRQIESFREYQTIFNATTEAIFVHDAQSGCILDINNRMLAMYGYTRDEALSADIGRLSEGTSPYSQEDAIDKFRKAKDEGPQVFEWLSRRKNGELFWSEVSFNIASTIDSDRLIAVVRDISERKNAENALKESEYFFKESQRAAQIGSYRADFKNDHWTSSEVMDAIFGITQNYKRTIQGWLNIVHPDDREMVRRHLTEEVIAGRTLFAKEHRIIRQNDGEIRWVNGLGEATFDNDGAILSLAGTIQDITTRKKGEEEVFNYNKLLQTIINTAPARVFWKDTELRYLGCNTAFAKDAGVASPNDLIGKDDFQLSWSDRAEQYRADDRHVIETGISKLSFDEQQTTPTGDCMWLRTSKAPLRNEAGKTIAVLGIYEDITERKQSEIALLRSEQNFRAIIDASPLPLALNDEHGTITYLNKAFLHIIGYTLSEIPTVEEWWPLAYPDKEYRQLVISTWLGHLTEAKRTGNPFTPMEINIVCKDGSVRTFICSTASLGDNFTGTHLVIFYDITDRKKVEDEKLILEQQFQQAQKLESLGVLAGGIAHDFNNILAIIMGYCSLTKMDYENAEDTIPHIEKAAERAAALCSQMLAYAGKVPFTRSKIDISLLVHEMVSMLKATTRQNVRIKSEQTADIPSVIGDASQIRQIVMNLIINATEAVGDAEGEVNVTLTTAEIKEEQSEKDHIGKMIAAGRYVCLVVTDSGCGMDDETRRKIFEPFYTTKFTGRGLGMSAVLGIINTHEGALQLESRLGQGATFKIYLPIQNCDTLGDAPLQPSPTVPWRGKGTILLAEDEEQVRNIAKELLEKFGFTVLTAENGREALNLYQKNAAAITLVITDMGMPIMDGFVLFSELKKLKPELPIIISSGYGDAEVSSRIARKDIAGLISKPYNFDQLREVLKNVDNSNQ